MTHDAIKAIPRKTTTIAPDEKPTGPMLGPRADGTPIDVDRSAPADD